MRNTPLLLQLLVLVRAVAGAAGASRDALNLLPAGVSELRRGLFLPGPAWSIGATDRRSPASTFAAACRSRRSSRALLIGLLPTRRRSSARSSAAESSQSIEGQTEAAAALGLSRGCRSCGSSCCRRRCR